MSVSSKWMRRSTSITREFGERKISMSEGKKLEIQIDDRMVRNVGQSSHRFLLLRSPIVNENSYFTLLNIVFALMLASAPSDGSFQQDGALSLYRITKRQLLEEKLPSSWIGKVVLHLSEHAPRTWLLLNSSLRCMGKIESTGFLVVAWPNQKEESPLRLEALIWIC